jgi:hypothetical protein
MTAAPPARDQMLARIRAAIAAGAASPSLGAPAGTSAAGDPDRADVDAAYAALPREYLRAHHDAGSHDIVALFAERAADSVPSSSGSRSPIWRPPWPAC